MPVLGRVIRNANNAFSGVVHCWSQWRDLSMNVAGSTRVIGCGDILQKERKKRKKKGRQGVVFSGKKR